MYHFYNKKTKKKIEFKNEEALDSIVYLNQRYEKKINESVIKVENENQQDSGPSKAVSIKYQKALLENYQKFAGILIILLIKLIKV